MTYAYRSEPFTKKLDDAKAAAEARKVALEEKKRQLGELRAAARMAEEFAIEEARVTEEIARISGGIKRLPPPIYGGPKGLEAAMQEIRDHQKNKRYRPQPRKE